MEGNKYDWKSLLNWIAIFLTIVTGCLTLYPLIKIFILFLIGNNLTTVFRFSLINIAFLILFPFSFVSSYLLVRKHLLLKGVEGEPYKFRLLVKRLNPFLSSHLVLEYHELYHLINCKKEDICKRTDPFSKDGRDCTAVILQRFNHILKIITSVDFSINIKLFEREDLLNGGFTSFDNAVLKTYERFQSGSEKAQIQNGLQVRRNVENYIVQHWEAEDKENLYHSIRAYRGSFKRNIAYDYSLGPTEHYWLSNNLQNDETKGRFHSTSTNYEKYYSSLGVFLIAPPLEAGKHIEDKDKVLGIIIFDSKESNVFHKIFTRHIMGYFAHIIYDYLMYYSLFNQKNGESKN